MRKRVSLIPLSILVSLLGMVSLFVPYLIIESYYYGEIYLSPMTSIGYLDWWSKYSYAAIIQFIHSIALFVLYSLIVPFSIVSVYKRRMSITVLVLFYIILACICVNWIVAMITIVQVNPNISTNYIYLYVLFAYVPLIPFAVIAGLNFKEYRQLVKTQTVVIQEKVVQISPEEKVVSTLKDEKDIPDQLRKWKDLLDDGIITKEEFDKKKEELLK